MFNDVFIHVIGFVQWCRWWSDVLLVSWSTAVWTLLLMLGCVMLRLGVFIAVLQLCVWWFVLCWFKGIALSVCVWCVWEYLCKCVNGNYQGCANLTLCVYVCCTCWQITKFRCVVHVSSTFMPQHQNKQHNAGQFEIYCHSEWLAMACAKGSEHLACAWRLCVIWA
jgi:hypothetical protein